MNKKFVWGWWIPEEDQHFESYFSQSIHVGDKRLYQPLESYFSQSIHVGDKRLYQPRHIDRCFLHIKKKTVKPLRLSA
jgi:hypothetical protein